MGRAGKIPGCMVLAACAALVGSCGGGKAAKTETLTIFGRSAVDGELWRELPAGAVAFTTNMLHVGDSYSMAMTQESQYRGILSFDLSAIPSGSTIDTAVLSIYQRSVSGTPYTDLGPLWVDHIVLSGAPDTHWADSLATGSLGVIATGSTLGRKSLIVTGAVADDLASGRTNSDYRLWFRVENDGDTEADVAEFDETFQLEFAGQVPFLQVTITR